MSSDLRAAESSGQRQTFGFAAMKMTMVDRLEPMCRRPDFGARRFQEVVTIRRSRIWILFTLEASFPVPGRAASLAAMSFADQTPLA